jgi:hypothetical protein
MSTAKRAAQLGEPDGALVVFTARRLRFRSIG